MATIDGEDIRIAETYLPDEPWERQKALAKEIVAAISLCEAELGQEIARDLEKLLSRA